MQPQPETIQYIICPQCHAELPATAERCDQCSAATASPVSTDDPAGDQRSKASRLSVVADTRWAMIMLLFLVTAGLGLPILWRSRAFSKRTKIVLTIIVSLYTVLVLWLIYLAGSSVVRNVIEIIDTVRDI